MSPPLRARASAMTAIGSAPAATSAMYVSPAPCLTLPTTVVPSAVSTTTCGTGRRSSIDGARGEGARGAKWQFGSVARV
eukprot:823841-Prymnesium_polylepis.1